MKLTEHQLKKIYQQSTRDKRGVDCPSGEELYQLLEPSAESANRSRIVSHLETCANCSEEFRMARELADKLRTRPAVQSGIWNQPYWRPSLAAVVCVLALITGITFYKRASVDSPGTVERGEESFEFRTEPSDGARLDSAPANLKWSAIPNVQTYRIVILNYESTVILRSEPLQLTEFAIPNDIKTRLEPRQVYYWRIEYESAGEQQSKLLSFSIR